MKFSVYATIVSIIAFLYALTLLAIPVKFVGHYGVNLDAGGETVARMFGASLLSLAIVIWLLRGQSPRDTAGKAVLWSTLFYNLATLIIGLNAILNNVVNSLGWSTPILNFIIALVSIYFLASKKQN